MNSKLMTHIDNNGRVHMVDVSSKPITTRTATAVGSVQINATYGNALLEKTVPKGEVLGTARLAGILAAKRTDELIPLCHSLPLNSVTVDFELKQDLIFIRAMATCESKTGVEMEALTAVSVAALTIYDMGKALDPGMTIGPIYLVKKTGGRSGLYERDKS